MAVHEDGQKKLIGFLSIRYMWDVEARNTFEGTSTRLMITKQSKVNAEIRAGVVELSGFVTTYAERDAAVKLVTGIDGVKDVINSIDITR